MKKKKRKKKVHNNLKITNIIITEICSNCHKRKPLHYYEEKDLFLGKKKLVICMCKECLSDLKFILLESPSKEHKELNENMITVINSMLDCNEKS